MSSPEFINIVPSNTKVDRNVNKVDVDYLEIKRV